MGRRVERSTRLVDFTDLGERVRCTVQGPGGEDGGAAWLVGCDGAHSVVRHRARTSVQRPTGRGPVDPRRLPTRRHRSGPHHHPLLPSGQPPGALPHQGRPVPDDGQHPPSVTGRTARRSDARGDPARPRQRGPGCGPRSDLVDEFRISERKVDHYRHGRCLLAERRPHPLARGRTGHEHRHPGRREPRVETRGWSTAASPPTPCWTPTARNAARSDGRCSPAPTLLRIATLRSRLAAALRNRVARIALGKERVQARLRNFLSGLSLHYPTDSIGAATTSAFAATDRRAKRARPALTSQHGADTRTIG